MRQIAFKGEKLSADIGGATMYRVAFEEFIKDNNFLPDNLYNGDECALFFKNLPNKTMALGEKKEAPSFKANKQRVTVMNCANSTGIHKVPLTIIGKSAKPKCFNGVAQLPVVYKVQKSSWMTVEATKPNEGEKFLPLLDNAPCNLSAEILNAIDPQFTVKYLPPNVTSLIQPMDQGVIESMKQNYNKIFPCKLLLKDSTNAAGIPLLLKSWTLLETASAVAHAWSLVSQSCLAKAWKNVLGEAFLPATTDIVSEKMQTLLNSVQSHKQYSIEETQEWIQQDVGIRTCHALSDAEMLDNVSRAENVEAPELEQGGEDESCTDTAESENDLDCSDTTQEESYLKKTCEYIIQFRKFFEKDSISTITDFAYLNNMQEGIETKLLDEMFKNSSTT